MSGGWGEGGRGGATIYRMYKETSSQCVAMSILNKSALGWHALLVHTLIDKKY